MSSFEKLEDEDIEMLNDDEDKSKGLKSYGIFDYIFRQTRGAYDEGRKRFTVAFGTLGAVLLVVLTISLVMFVLGYNNHEEDISGESYSRVDFIIML